MSTTISTLPSPEVVRNLLDRMVPNLESLEVASDQPALESLTKPVGSLLRNDEDECIGIIMLDLVGAIELGGELMMTPVGGREDLLESGALDEFARDAVSELINVLTTTINVADDNPRVRSMQPRDLDDLGTDPAAAWLHEDHERVDFECGLKLGQGRLMYLGRKA